MKSDIWEKLKVAEKVSESEIQKATDIFDKVMEKAILEFKNKQAKTLVEAATKIVN